MKLKTRKIVLFKYLFAKKIKTLYTITNSPNSSNNVLQSFATFSFNFFPSYETNLKSPRLKCIWRFFIFFWYFLFYFKHFSERYKKIHRVLLWRVRENCTWKVSMLDVDSMLLLGRRFDFFHAQWHLDLNRVCWKILSNSDHCDNLR